MTLHLRWHLTTHSHRQVFVTPNFEWHCRSNFSRRAFRPAAVRDPPRRHVQAAASFLATERA